MTRARRVLTAVGLCSVLLGACDKVGAPLVDRLPAGPPEPLVVPCTPPPECDAPAPSADTHPPVAVTPIDLVACGTARSRTCTLREPAEAVEVATAAPSLDSDAGALPEVPIASCAQQLAFGDGADVQCEAIELVAEGGDHLITGLTLRSVNLSIRASRPTTLTLQGATLDAVYAELQGPITLRVEAAREVASLRAVTSASDLGEPQLELLQVDATGLQTAGTADAYFAGTLRLDQVELQDAQLLAERMELQSVALDSGRIGAGQLTTTDVQISNTTLALEDAVLSATRLTGTTFESCDTLVLVASRVRTSTLVPCSGPPARVYASEVLASHADGRFESDSSLWEGVAFGSSADTELIGFSGALRSVNFCQAALRPELGGSLALRCSKCDGWSPSTRPPCRVTGTDGELGFYPNFCSLIDVRMFLGCPEPAPKRNRPREQPF